MLKSKEVFSCSKCDAQFPKWEGKCRECGAWDTLKIVTVTKSTSQSSATIIDFSKIGKTLDNNRLSTGSKEFDRVLGGGLVLGVLVLIGGDPGVGKSTLLLQTASIIAQEKQNEKPVLYVSGEESAEQLKNRLDRLNLSPNNLRYLGEPTVNAITDAINSQHPKLVIVDSLQTIRNSGGAISTARQSELRNATEALMELAKTTSTPIILIGHVTKDGGVAGPKVLEHLVDAVLYFETGENGQYRILRAAKNRFGGLQEVGVWKMVATGLEEVPNPSASFLSDKRLDVPGTAVTALIKGSRVFLIEVQALVSKTRFGYPQRRSTGFDLNRLQLLLAVLSKRLNLPMQYYDVHLNVAGGLKANEPAIDLPVTLAIASAFKNKSLPKNLITIGEVGLAGEIRNVEGIENRIETASRLGFEQIIIPKQIQEIKNTKIIQHQVSTVEESFSFVF